MNHRTILAAQIYRDALSIGILVGVCIAVSNSPGALPLLRKPLMPVTQAQRDQDVRAFREWLYSDAGSPTIQAVERLKSWTDANPNDGEALFFLALSYRRNLTYEQVKPSEVKDADVASLIKQSADAGFVPAKSRYAMILMGWKLLESSGEPPDMVAGLKMLESCIQENDPDAYLYKGMLLLRGDAGFKLDPSAAEHYLQKSAKLGVVTGFAALASAKEMQGDEVTARTLLQKAAQMGDPQAQLALGEMNMYLATTPQESRAAYELVKKSAEGKFWLSEAHATLADYYSAGKGVPLDEQKAFHWYSIAWDLGNERAGLEVAGSLIEGRGCEANRAAGLEILQHLSAKNYDRAQ